MLPVVWLGALLEHKVVEGNEVEDTLLEVDHKEVEVIRFPLVIEFVVEEVQIDKCEEPSARYHYNEHKKEEKVHLK